MLHLSCTLLGSGDEVQRKGLRMQGSGGTEAAKANLVTNPGRRALPEAAHVSVAASSLNLGLPNSRASEWKARSHQLRAYDAADALPGTVVRLTDPGAESAGRRSQPHDAGSRGLLDFSVPQAHHPGVTAQCPAHAVGS